MKLKSFKTFFLSTAPPFVSPTGNVCVHLLSFRGFIAISLYNAKVLNRLHNMLILSWN